MDRKGRSKLYEEAVFPSYEYMEGLSGPAWAAAEKYISACTKDFSPLAAVRAAVRGTTLIGLAGSYKAAAAAVRAIWTRLFGTNLNVDRLKKLDGVVPDHILSYAVHMAEHGVDAAYTGERGTRKTCKPHPSVTGKLLEVLEVTWKDVQAGRVLMGTDKANLVG